MGAIIRLGERHARAYVAEPDGSPTARVLVVHDAYGLLPHVRFLCDELAQAGFVALAPDLFAGDAGPSLLQASRQLEQLRPTRADRLLQAALRGYAALGHERGPDGAVGFSVGAEFTAGMAAGGLLDAFVSYYGLPSEEHRRALAVPTMAHWAEHDRWDAEGGPDELVAELMDAGVDVVSHVYPGTTHGFANADIDAFDLDAAQLAWQRTVAFLRTRLRG